MDYFALDKAALCREHEHLLAEYRRFQQMGLKLDMSRGKPSPEQLDLSLELLQIAEYTDSSGVDARNYGQLEGLPEARAFFAELLGVPSQQVVVGGASSLEMMYEIMDMAWHYGVPGGTAPWGQCPKRKFLCPAPGYDRHFRISEKMGFELLPVPMTPTGPDMDVVEKLAQDEDVKGIWCIPVYSNPDGYTYSAETVRRLAQMWAAAPDFRVFWDNAYLAHSFKGELSTCPNFLDECVAAGNENRAFMFCSTSKITFAGAGVCAVAGSPQNIDAILQYLFTVTICFDKLNQLRHVRFLRNAGGVHAHMKKHAALMAPKFEKVIGILHQKLDAYPGIARWTEPTGGYFLSFFARKGTAKRIVELCKQAGVVLTGAGAAYPYGKDPADSHIRIAPSFPPLAELQLAAELLCVSTRLAVVEQLMAD